jgi:hypothetical protein
MISKGHHFSRSGSPARLSGQLSKPATLTVNGAPATVQANNFFTYGPVTLAEGANAFALTATDAVGNVGRLAATVTLDSVPPALAGLPALVPTGQREELHLCHVRRSNVQCLPATPRLCVSPVGG